MKLFFLSILAALTLPAVASAATVSFTAPSGAYTVDRPVTVSVYLNTGADPVNAATINVAYDPLAADITAPSRAGSSFNVWIAEPRVVDGTVFFEGASTAPFTGTGKIGEFTLTPKHAGTVTVTTGADTVAYRADGSGTPLPVTGIPLALDVSGAAPVAPPVQTTDNTPPESVTLDVGSDGRGGYLAAWSVSDSGSGYDHAEISVDGGAFRLAQSPYALGNTLPESVTIRVYDRAGNSRDFTWRRRAGFRVDASTALASTIVLLLILILIARRLLWRKTKRT